MLVNEVVALTLVWDIGLSSGRAIFVKLQEPPCQLDHAPAHANLLTLRRAWRCKTLRSATQFGVKAADIQAGKGGFQPVDDASAFADQVLTFTRRTHSVLLLESGDRGHAAMIWLAV